MKNSPQLSVLINHLLTGQKASFGPNGEPSAIHKTAIHTPLTLTRLGLVGDEQADPTVHGGPEKALHHFPVEHYAAFATLIPDFPSTVGGFGENLSSTGITEKDVCLGDLFQLGDAVIQLSQGRQPCWKLNVRFKNRSMAKIVQQQGWTGWYYRVITEGQVCAGDQLTLIERPYPAANLEKIMGYMYHEPLDLTGIKDLINLPVLPERWRTTLQKRLDLGVLEDQSRRIETPARLQN